MAKKMKIKKKKVLKRREVKGLKRILVSLPGGPRAVVEAEDFKHAWAKYKSLCGIVQSDHQPTFRRYDPSLKVNDLGIVVDDMGQPILGSVKEKDWDGMEDVEVDEDVEEEEEDDA